MVANAWPIRGYVNRIRGYLRGRVIGNAPPLQGHVDNACTDQFCAFGWVDNSDRNGPDVDIYVNGQLAQSAVAATRRRDLVEAGLPDARGFNVSLYPKLTPGTNQIEIRFSGTDQILPNGVKSVEFKPFVEDEAVDAHWSNFYANQWEQILRWWQCDDIVRHVNEKVCGKRLSGQSVGLYELVRSRYADRRFLRGISVGCGQGTKEFDLMEYLPVERFDLYELSQFAVESGSELAVGRGLGERVAFHYADAFAQNGLEETFDILMWNNALHHMPDVDKAIAWSRRVLKPGGLFIMDDFVGPTRMQFAEWVLDFNSKLRRQMPKRYLTNPRNPYEQLPLDVPPIDPDALYRHDPSECADSGRILHYLKVHFPEMEIIPTGGAAYHVGLNDVLHNIVQAEDVAELKRWLEADDQLISKGETHYAVAIAEKK